MTDYCPFCRSEITAPDSDDRELIRYALTDQALEALADMQLEGTL